MSQPRTFKQGMPLRNWLVFVTVVAARLAFGVQTYSVGAVGPELIDSLDLSFAALGTLVGVYSLPGIAFAFPGSWLSTKVGDRNLVLGGLFMMAGGSLLMAVAGGYPLLLAGRLLAGCGYAFLSVILSKLMLDYVPKTWLAILMGTYIAGYVAGCALGQSLLPMLSGWRLAMTACGVLCALCLLAAVFTIPGAGSSITAKTGFRLLPGTLVPLLLMSSVWALGNASFMTAFSFMPSYFVGQGMPLVQAGGLSSLGLYACLITTPFGGWILSHRIGLERGSIASSAAITALTALVPCGLDPAFIVIGMGLLIGLCGGPLFTLATENLAPEERALAMALLFSLFNVTMAVGPAIAGLAQDLSGWPAMPFLVAALYMALATLALVAHGVRRARVGTGRESARP